MTNHQSTLETNYASFFNRLMATISDFLILGLISQLCLVYIVSAANEVDLFSRVVLVITLALLPLIVFGAIYHAWFLSQSGATPGKQMWGVVVVDEDGQLLSFGMAFFRGSVLKLVSSFALGLGYLWMIGNKQKQTWHDMLAGTYAKSTDVSALVSITWFVLLLAAHAALVVYLIGRVPFLLEVLTGLISP